MLMPSAHRPQCRPPGPTQPKQIPVTLAHNRYSDNKLTMREMATIWWAGLMRGAVSGGQA